MKKATLLAMSAVAFAISVNASAATITFNHDEIVIGHRHAAVLDNATMGGDNLLKVRVGKLYFGAVADSDDDDSDSDDADLIANTTTSDDSDDPDDDTSDDSDADFV
jgi:hypothetical protein